MVFKQRQSLDTASPSAQDSRSSMPSVIPSAVDFQGFFVPYSAYFYLVPGPMIQKRLCDRFGFHPQARKGLMSFGGMHISICDQMMKAAFLENCKSAKSGTESFKHGLDRNRIEVTGPEVEQLAREKVATAAASVSGTDWKRYISDPHNVAFYDLRGRYICRADDTDTIVREISCGRVVRGIDFEPHSELRPSKNPLELYFKPQEHFHSTLYSVNLDEDGHSTGFDLATAVEIWKVIKDRDWYFALSTDRSRTGYVGNPGQDFQFEWEWANELSEPEENP
jgi:hypothetical protein